MPTWELTVYKRSPTTLLSAFPRVSINSKGVIIYVGENYLCKYVTHITLKKIPQKQLFLDFRGISIGNFKVNGTAVAEQGVSSFRNHKVYIPTEALKVGEDHTNIVSFKIHFLH